MGISPPSNVILDQSNDWCYLFSNCLISTYFVYFINMTITEFSECNSKKELLKMLSSVQIIWVSVSLTNGSTLYIELQCTEL